ncbi:hypothetical protein BCR44DRAFT_1423105 [Catenaria anguillulae PL171]|uniref:Uncharacterized protein n=1 Tax=Catenaria anguillulae PL171 TaxID=765915 RepID=A0A1Y2I7U3_9FUNG|nr:hypothetical protein BCR44DRAFT_1423105 [Catenaria anguillulae PL171]
MPPKRAKGLKQSSSSAADPSAAAPPATKQPLYIGDSKTTTKLPKPRLAGAAKSRLFGAAVGSAEHTQGRTLMRAALHECSRLLALEESLPAPDRAALRPVYAQALVWAAAHRDADVADEDDMPSKHELIALADAVWKVYKAAEAISQDDREELAWVAVRRLEHLEPEGVAKWADMCAKLWEDVKNEQACARGMGAVKLAQGSVVVADRVKWLPRMRVRSTRRSSKRPKRRCKKLLTYHLLIALTLLTRAKDLDDHPSEIVYQPLGDVCVQLGTAAELLDNVDDATHHYLMAVRFLEKAREHNAEAVDEDQIDQLKEVVRD